MYWIPIIICRFYHVKIGTFNKIIEQADFCKNYYWLVCLDVHHVSDLIKAAIYHLNDIMEWLKKNVLLRVCSVCVCQYGCLVCKTVDLCVQIETNKFPSNLLCWSLWGVSFVKFSILPFWNAKKKQLLADDWTLDKKKKIVHLLRKVLFWLFGAILWYFFLSSNGVRPSVTTQQYRLSQTKLL